MRKLLTAAFILLFTRLAYGQAGSETPRIILNFNGSTTVPTMDLGGWTRMRVSAATPPVSAAGEARFYFNGTKWQISENGGAYVNVVISGIPATASANTFFAGPTTGAAAAPAFRVMNINDVPNGFITFAKWASNSCATGNIPKWNGTAWACAGDDTSPGGASWLTSGNTLGAGTATLGSNDAFGFNLVASGTSFMTVTSGGTMQPHGQIASDLTTAHAFTTQASSGSLFGYYKFGQRSVPSGFAAPGATESVMYMDSGDGHVYLREGLGTAFRIGAIGTVTQTYLVWSPKEATQPATAFAAFDVRNSHPILAYSDAVTEAGLFEGLMPEEWDGTTFDIFFSWTGTVTTGNVRWECAFERNDTATDIDADSFGTVVLVTSTTGTTSGFPRSTVCSMSSAAIRDNIVAGEPFRIRIRRIGADAADTMAGEAQILMVQMRHP